MLAAEHIHDALTLARAKDDAMQGNYTQVTTLSDGSRWIPCKHCRDMILLLTPTPHPLGVYCSETCRRESRDFYE